MSQIDLIEIKLDQEMSLDATVGTKCQGRSRIRLSGWVWSEAAALFAGANRVLLYRPGMEIGPDKHASEDHEYW
jgi:hypothetical protein